MINVTSRIKKTVLLGNIKCIIVVLSSAFIGVGTMNAQVGIGTNTPDASAIIELQSTEKGFLPPRLSTAQRDAMSSHAEGLVIYNLDNKCLEFFDGANWLSVCDGSIVTSPPAVVSVTSANGRIWMDRNLGASRVAISFDDDEGYGSLFQWGRAPDGHEDRSLSCSAGCFNAQSLEGVSNFNNDPTNEWFGKFVTSTFFNWLNASVSDINTLWQGVDGTNNPCPDNYRLPTDAEWTAEYNSWQSQNASGGFASPLKLPATGYRNRLDGAIMSLDMAFYWSSSINNVSNNPRFVWIASSWAFLDSGFRAHGYAVRCIKDL
jgi:hypothetical protein